MGHAVDFLVCEKRDQIIPGCKMYAAENVDRGENPSGSYHGNMKILDSEPIKKSYEDAVNFLDNRASGGFYSDYAVRFYDVDSVKATKKVTEFEGKLRDNRNKKREYEAAHSIKTHKSAQIGCRKCNSKLTVSYLRSEYCPVCRADLRADYITERLEKFDADYKEIRKKVQTEKEKASNKAPVKWCYKVEVHC